MKTRSRTTSQSIAVDENVAKEAKVVSTRKVSQKPSSNAVVASIISSIKEENSAQKLSEAKSTSDSNGQKNSALKKAGPKAVRGLPKSGRPWKETKQRYVV